MWSYITNLQNLHNFIYFLFISFSNITYCDIAMLLIHCVFMEGLEGKEKRSFLHVLWMQFPEADGNYTSFKDPSNTDLDLAFFE